ncbi:MAG: hypothetical protein LUQ01_05620 [Methanolinea sp.]|nr:hypothetical protein [Methanolinea sp.]
MILPIVNAVRGWLGGSPNSRPLEIRIPREGSYDQAAGVLNPVRPDPGSGTAGRVACPDWITAVAIIILFATLFFGGLFWWPFFTGAVLVLCLAYVWFHRSMGAC